jgi:tetrahydromethanopterin S-methyltransferase subunit G
LDLLFFLLFEQMKILIVLFFFLAVLFAQQTTIISGPSTVTTSGSGAAWNNSTNIQVNNTNNPTNVSLNRRAFSQTLSATNFSFSIPYNTLINNITVTYFRKGPSDLSDNSVDLIINGVANISTNQAGVAWTNTYQAAVYSGWNESLSFFTSAMINDPSFGVSLVVYRGSGESRFSETANVYYVQILVTYEIVQTTEQQTTEQQTTEQQTAEFTTVFQQEDTTTAHVSAVNDQTQNNSGQIAGAVIGVIFGLILLAGVIVLVVYLLKRKKKKHSEEVQDVSIAMSSREKELFRKMSQNSLFNSNEN